MKRRKLLSVLSLGAAFLAAVGFAACSDDEGTTATTDEYAIKLSRTAMRMVEYDVSTLSATLTKNGETFTDTIVWSTSNDTVATVADGTVTAVAEGSATVSAVWGEYMARCEITVEKYYDPEWSISLDTNALSLFKSATEGEQRTLTVSATYGSEALESTAYTVSWASDDTSVATVENGTVTAVAAGTAKVTATATYEGFTAQATCTVKVGVQKTNVLDEVKYTYDAGAMDSEAKIPVNESYGAVESVTDAQGAEIGFEQVGKYVYLDFSTSAQRGTIALTIETATHSISANMYVADGFIDTLGELENAFTKMKENTLFVLNADIDLSKMAWTGDYLIPSLKGEWDGNGHKLFGNTIPERKTVDTRVINGFTASSHVHDLYFKLAYTRPDLSVAGYWGAVGPIGALDSGAVVENCVFDMDLAGIQYSDGLFQSVAGTLRNNVFIYKWIRISNRINGTVEDNVLITSNENYLTNFGASSLGGSNGNIDACVASWGMNFSAAAKVQGFYIYTSAANALNGEGKAVDENKDGKVLVNGTEYTLVEIYSDADLIGTANFAEETSKKITEVVSCVRVQNGNCYWHNILLA